MQKLAIPHPILLIGIVAILSFGMSQPLEGQSADVPVPDAEDLQTITADNAANLQELARFSPAKPVLKFFFSPDSTTLYSGANEQPIEVWDLESGARQVFEVDYGYFGFAVSPDNTLIAVNSSTDLGGIGLYDIESGERIADIPCSGGSLAIAFNPNDSKMLVVGVITGLPSTALHFWHIRTDLPNGWDEQNIHNCKPDLRLTVSTLNNLTISPDGQLLLYGNHLLDMNTLTEVAALTYERESTIRVAAFSPDSQQLATTSGSFVKVWDSKGNQISTIDLGEPKRPVGPWITSVVFSPNGELLAIGGAGVIPTPGQPRNFVALAETTSYEPIHWLVLEDDIPTGETVAFSPNGKLLAVGGSTIVLYGIPASPTPSNH